MLQSPVRGTVERFIEVKVPPRKVGRLCVNRIPQNCRLATGAGCVPTSATNRSLAAATTCLCYPVPVTFVLT